MTDGSAPPADQVQQLQAQLAAALADVAHLKEKLDAALDGTGICIWQGHPQSGDLTVFNYQNFEIGDMAPHFGLWLAKLHPHDKQAVLDNYYAHLAGKTPCYEAVYRTFNPDGSVCWLWDRGRVVERDGTGQPLRILGAHRDITQEKEHEAQLAMQARLDPLTGLANRRGLLDFLKSIDRRGGSYALAMVDVDHFKLFNDLHGHDIGDRVLIAIAHSLSEPLSDYDLCGRWGGEEFLLVLGNADIAAANDVIVQLHQAVQRLTISSGEQDLSTTVSIGLTVHQPGENFDEVLLRADRALLSAKRKGRNMVCRR